MHIARFAAFLVWIFCGDSCTTVLIFCSGRFNAVYASLSIMFNSGVCPTFYNVSDKTSYARNMSASLLFLMVSAKISFVSYAYSINMYCIPLSMVTGKRPVKYVYTFPVSGSVWPIAENKEFVFSSLSGNNLFPYPVLVAHYFLIWCSFAFYSNVQR